MWKEVIEQINEITAFFFFHPAFSLWVKMISALRDDERKYATAVINILLFISKAQAWNCCQIIRFMQVQDG